MMFFSFRTLSYLFAIGSSSIVWGGHSAIMYTSGYSLTTHMTNLVSGDGYTYTFNLHAVGGEHASCQESCQSNCFEETNCQKSLSYEGQQWIVITDPTGYITLEYDAFQVDAQGNQTYVGSPTVTIAASPNNSSITQGGFDLNYLSDGSYTLTLSPPIP